VSQASPTLAANAGLRRVSQLSATQKSSNGSSLASMADPLRAGQHHGECDLVGEHARCAGGSHEQTGGFLITDSSKRMLRRIMKRRGEPL